MTHICVVGSDNGLSPVRRQAIIWTNARILLIGPLGTNFSEIVIEIGTFLCKKMYLQMSSGKWQPFCLGLNVLMTDVTDDIIGQYLDWHDEVMNWSHIPPTGPLCWESDNLRLLLQYCFPEIRAWIGNCISRVFLCDKITYAYHKFSDNLTHWGHLTDDILKCIF